VLKGIFMIRYCRKCNEIIPNSIIIDNKRRNLKNRKFCLECSPFGKHNTCKTEPLTPVYKSKYSTLTDEQKNNHLQYQYSRRQKKMKELLEIYGSKCSVCGYDKCTRALHFHHLDKKTKKIELNVRNILSFKWSEILDEANKCQLVCANCHAEIEDKINVSKYKDT
jgi:hypothetical protein